MATKKTSGKAKTATKAAAPKAAPKTAPKKAPREAAPKKDVASKPRGAAPPAAAQAVSPAVRPGAELVKHEEHAPVIREEGELTVRESAVPATVETIVAAPAPKAGASKSAARGEGMLREISPRPKPQGNPYKPPQWPRSSRKPAISRLCG